MLEDGLVSVDWINFQDVKVLEQVSLEIYYGCNCIVWCIFEYLGYQVEKLDWMYLVGFIKKDLLWGYFCYLSQKEIIMFKYFVCQV